MSRLDPYCDYFGDLRDDEFAPGDRCEDCYRYEICVKAILLGELPVPE